MPLALDFKPVKSLLGMLPWIGRSESSDDLNDKIQMVIFRLKDLEARISEIRIRFERRAQELYKKMLYAYQRGEKKRALIYAEEVVHLRNLLTLVYATERLILRAIERLRTASDVKELTEVLLAFSAAVDEVRSQMQGLYPGLALAFEEIKKNINLLLIETAPPAISDIDVDTVSSEAEKMLEEVMKQAEQSVGRVIPEESVSKMLENMGFENVLKKARQGAQSPKRQRRPVAAPKPSVVQRAAATTAAAPASQTATVPVAALAVSVERRRLSPEELEKKLLDYILDHGGFLDINDFTRRYGVTREEVLAALNNLHRKGLIRLA